MVKTQLVASLEDARSKLISIFDDLEGERLIGPALHHVEPPLWEVGHVAWFQEYWLLRHLDQHPPRLPHGDGIYDAIKVSYKQRTKHDYPSKQETLDYAAGVLQAAIGRLATRIPSPQETYLYQLCTLHEYMHTENMISVRQSLAYPAPMALRGRTLPDVDRSYVDRSYVPRDIEIPAGPFEMGSSGSTAFAFDNELPHHTVDLPSFRIASTAVTNAQYREFVRDGGYATRSLWDRRGWQWRRREAATQPRFWTRRDDDWAQHRFAEVVPLEPWHPVCHVNWHEARAFCRWAHRRLPSEAEWEKAACWGPDANQASPRPWGEAPATTERANIDCAAGGTVDVRALARGDSRYGCRQMVGNVWEWTDSILEPFSGFTPGPYRDYSMPYFGQKPVLRGGAWLTQPALARNSYRNFFIRHRRTMYAGFRTCAP
ncbi:MAG: selenoneine synthase SenA [Nannocystaceae bacterium]